MRGQHDYDTGCQCYRCKGIRNSPTVKAANKRRKGIRASVYASRAEQHGRYLDSGPQNWDDR